MPTPLSTCFRPASRAEWGWLLSGVGIFLTVFFYATVHGVGMTSDSYSYLSAARSFAATGELRNPDGSVFTVWPPLFPVVLAAWGKATGLSWQWLQAACLASSLVLWGRLGQQLLQHQRLAQLYVLTLACSTPWLLCGGFLWSEAVFILLLSGYVYSLFGYAATGRRAWFLLATGCGFLLPLQRITGFFVLAGVGLGVAIIYWEWAKARKGLLLTHGLLVLAGGGVWQYYSLVLANARSLEPPREWLVWLQASGDYGHAMGRWLTLLTPRAEQAYVLYAMLFLMLAAVGARVPGPRFLRLVATIVPVVVLPLVPLAWLGMNGAGLTDADRYTAVVYAPFFLLLFAQLQRLFTPANTVRRQQIVFVVGLCWMLYPATRMVRNAIFLHNRPPAANTTRLYPD